MVPRNVGLKETLKTKSPQESTGQYSKSKLMVTGKFKVSQLFLKNPSGWAFGIDKGRVAVRKKLKLTAEKYSH